MSPPCSTSSATHPLIGFHTRPTESWLRDVLAAEGNLRAGAALASDAILALAVAKGEPVARIEEVRLSRLLTWGYTHHLPALCGPDVLRGQARRGAERRAVEATKARLAEATNWLHAGGSLYSSPEGGFSPDGRLGRITSGFHRLLRAAPADTRVVPVAIVYDFMTARRMRMFVDLGPAIARAPELPRGELDARLRDAWRAAARFTCTQLGAGFLVERGRSADPVFTSEELASEIGQQAQTLASAGRHVDVRLLAPDTRRRLAANFLAEAVRRGVAQAARPQGAGRWRATPSPLDIIGDITLAPGEVGYPSAPLAYAWNEYRDLLTRDVLPESAGQPAPAAQAAKAVDARERDQLGA